MFKFTKFSSFGINSLIKINCQPINKTIIRTKRQIISRRPVKILTDSGKDYYKQNDYTEPISSPNHEIRPNLLNERQRREYNKYFDEGFDDQFLDFTADQTDGRNIEPSKAKQSVKRDVKQQKKLNDTKQKIRETDNKWQRNDSKERNKFEKVLKPKIAGIPVYDKISDKSSEFSNIMSTLKQRKRREKENLMLLEGKRLICDAIDSNINIKTIYFSKEENLVEIQNLDELVAKGLKLTKVLYRDMKLFSELTTSPGVIAICERPHRNHFVAINESNNNQILPLILIGDNVRDPGNLGTMVRCAAAVGAQKLILMKGCADAWDSKVLRSGAGSHFRIPIVADIEWPVIFNHIPVDRPFDLFIADSNDNSNKGQKRDNCLEIPSHTINTITREIDYQTEEIYFRDDSYDDSNPELIKYKNLSIAPTSYVDTKFYTLGIDRPAVLIIGGETHGLSNQSYKLAYDYIGRKIKIPLSSGVDSLNSAISAAVIMYEMKRQFLCRQNISSSQTLESNV